MHKEASLFDDSLTRSGEILTKGFLPDSVSTALTFVLGHGKQNMNSSCNWSNFGEIWQKSRKSDEYKLRSCKRDISVVEDINMSTDIEEISRSCFDSTIKKMHATSSPIKDGFVYKRRKMQRNTVALLSGENAAEVTEENTVSEFNLSSSDYHLAVHEDSSDDVQAAIYLSNDCQDSERPSFSGRHHFDVHASLNSQLIDNKNLESVKKCVNNDHSSARDVSYSAEGFTNKLCCSSTENCSTTNGTTFAATKSCVPCASISTAAGEHSEDCSTSGAIFLESLEKFESPEEMCIYVLRRHGLLGESSRKSACVSSENLGFVGPLFSPCKICSISESALKMLICDDCEEAFHLSCCRPKIKRLPRDEWYCQSCFIKKRKHLLKKNMGTSSGNVGDVSESGGPIASMLRDIHPHRSRVRIGEDFQVDVPDWTDLFSNDEYFDEPKEMDHADLCSFEGWSWSKSSKSHTIGNWLQCKDEDDNGNICGKWRRAPIFCVQTDDWDCSCAVLWDPIHADCAVPQELDTEEVLKHLKYVEMDSAIVLIKFHKSNHSKHANEIISFYD